MPSEHDSGIVIEMAGPSRTHIVRDLFREYEQSVDAPACFEDFEFVPEPAYHHPTAPGAQLLIKRLSPPA